jgi:anti-sigma regulatory factor (Ser/Thr protein kinase)
MHQTYEASVRLAYVRESLQTEAVSAETTGYQDASVALPEDPGAAALARDFAAEQLVRSGYLGRHDEVVLAVSELVSNALLHGSGAPTIRLLSGPRRARIEVYDDSPELPEQRAQFGPQGGWGLVMVGRMAAWGSFRRGTGKVVWCEATPESAVRGTVHIGLTATAVERGVSS